MRASAGGAWGGRCYAFGAQLTAHQRPRANRNCGCRKSVSDLLGGFALLCRYGAAYKDESAYVTMDSGSGTAEGHAVLHKRVVINRKNGKPFGTYVGTSNDRNDMPYNFYFDSNNNPNPMIFYFFYTKQERPPISKRTTITKLLSSAKKAITRMGLSINKNFNRIKQDYHKKYTINKRQSSYHRKGLLQ